VIAQEDDDGALRLAAFPEGFEDSLDVGVHLFDSREVFGPVLADDGGVRQVRWKPYFVGFHADGLVVAVGVWPM
jgi:hypothetical protein